MRDVPTLLNLRRPGLTCLRCRRLPSPAPGASQWGCSSGSSPSSSSAHGRACRCGCTALNDAPCPPLTSHGASIMWHDRRSRSPAPALPPPPPSPPRRQQQQQQQQRGVGSLLHLFAPWLTPCLLTYSARPADLDHGALTDQPRPPPSLLRVVPQIQGVVAPRRQKSAGRCCTMPTGAVRRRSDSRVRAVGGARRVHAGTISAPHRLKYIENITLYCRLRLAARPTRRGRHRPHPLAVLVRSRKTCPFFLPVARRGCRGTGSQCTALNDAPCPPLTSHGASIMWHDRRSRSPPPPP
eukprot:COSAG01_NODE_6462_length_3654_cov_4.264416_4_plen_295_part_01